MKEKVNLHPTSVKELMYREQSRLDYTYIRKQIKGKLGKGIQTILVKELEESDNWIRITDGSTIEEQITKRNIKHFGQANNTAFATPPLVNIFGYSGTNENSTKLIEEQELPDSLPNNK
jgi:hypothetical protein